MDIQSKIPTSLLSLNKKENRNYLFHLLIIILIIVILCYCLRSYYSTTFYNNNHIKEPTEIKRFNKRR